MTSSTIFFVCKLSSLVDLERKELQISKGGTGYIHRHKIWKGGTGRRRQRDPVQTRCPPPKPLLNCFSCSNLTQAPSQLGTLMWRPETEGSRVHGGRQHMGRGHIVVFLPGLQTWMGVDFSQAIVDRACSRSSRRCEILPIVRPIIQGSDSHWKHGSTN